MVVEDELCPPQAGNNSSNVIKARNSAPPKTRRRRLNRLPTPRPRNARPATGNQLAYKKRPGGCKPAVVVTRGKVLITRVTVDGLEPCKVTGFVDGVQVVPPPGSPDEHAMEIDAVKLVSGVIWIG